MTPVDINLYKTAILKDSEEIINDSKKPISNLTLEKTINLNIKNAKMASFKFQ